METPRYNIYQFIHKALRALMNDVLVKVGRTDGGDDEAVHQTLNNCDDLLDICRSHLHHENEFIHSAMLAHLPKANIKTVHDHVEHEHHIANLQAEVDKIRNLPSLRRQQALLSLYRNLALFIADNFQHMQTEETENCAFLWEFYSDEQIMQIEFAIVSSLSPQENAKIAYWMLPNLNHSERLGVVSGMQAGMPPEAFSEILQMLSNELSSADWQKLCHGLDIDPSSVSSIAA